MSDRTEQGSAYATDADETGSDSQLGWRGSGNGRGDGPLTAEQRSPESRGASSSEDGWSGAGSRDSWEESTETIPSVEDDRALARQPSDPPPGGQTASSAPSPARAPAPDPAPPAAESSADEESATPASTRVANLRMTRVEPWSVAKLAFVVSVAMMIVAVVAVSLFWLVMDITGVWNQINESISTVLSDDSQAFDVTDYFGFGRLVGLALVLSAINVVLMTALATIGAHLYNLAAQLLGGIEMSFSDDTRR